MKKTIIVGMVLAIGLLTPTVKAEIVSVSAAPLSTAGAAAAIIAPPTDVLNTVVTNTGQQGFNERMLVTTVDHGIDGGGTIPAGTWVNSHMIFLNALPGPNIYHNNVVWTFSGPIIGVMSDYNGNLEILSTPELGAPSTNYPAAGFPARGIEGADNYTISGSQLTVTMGVDPAAGDWIRVVTLALNIEIDRYRHQARVLSKSIQSQEQR